MNIREALLEDMFAIASIEQIPEYRSFVGSWTVEEHQTAFADPDCLYLVVKHSQDSQDAQDAVAGFLILRGLQSEAKALEIKRVAVRTPNRGLGRRLVQVALDRAFSVYGAQRVWLDLFETNSRARHVYESLGFRQDGFLRDAVERDGQYFNLNLMSIYPSSRVA